MDDELLRHDRDLRSCLCTRKHWNLSELLQVVLLFFCRVTGEVLDQIVVLPWYSCITFKTPVSLSSLAVSHK